MSTIIEIRIATFIYLFNISIQFKFWWLQHTVACTVGIVTVNQYGLKQSILSYIHIYIDYPLEDPDEQ